MSLQEAQRPGYDLQNRCENAGHGCFGFRTREAERILAVTVTQSSPADELQVKGSGGLPGQLGARRREEIWYMEKSKGGLVDG